MTDDHLGRNRAEWNRAAPEYQEAGRRGWADDEPRWGIFGVPEADVGMLDLALEGRGAIELGCGTAYVSSWLARRGARPVGIDLSENQLANAAAFRREYGLPVRLVHGNAERLPFADESFDVAISEYGASIWCDPYRWIPEASRVLRSGGDLRFLVNGTLAMLCVPDTDAEGPADERLKRPYFGMHRFEWPEDEGVEFHLGYGEWIRLLRANGFEVLDMREVRPPEDAETRYPWMSLAWARRWPCEEVWIARKTR